MIMNEGSAILIEQAKKAALEVLMHNNHGPYRGLPRTAGWGYPEPYTRDLLISSLGILTTGNKALLKSIEKVLNTLAKNQNSLGHIPSLVHDSDDCGSSDCTPLFLFAAGLWRKITENPKFLADEVDKALIWMKYQSPCGRGLIGQLPTSDWRDEQKTLFHG